MSKLMVLLLVSLSLTACQKKPDPPAPVSEPAVSTNPPPPSPPPVSSCQGATVMYSMPVDTIPDNSIKSFVIPNFELSCGDSLQVFIRNPQSPQGQGWTELHDVANGGSYFSILNQTVTVHNSTGIVVEVDIEAILK